MTSTLGIYSSQAASWIGGRRSSGMLEAIMASGVSLHHLSYAVILWPALLQFAKVGVTLTVAAWVFGVFPSIETLFWLLAAAGATAVAVWAFGLMGVAWTVAGARIHYQDYLTQCSLFCWCRISTVDPTIMDARHQFFTPAFSWSQGDSRGTDSWANAGLVRFRTTAFVECHWSRASSSGHKLVDWSYDYARRNGGLAAR